MRTLTLQADITPSRLRYNRDLYPREIKGTLPTLLSGEWCQFSDETRKKIYLGYYNPHTESAPPGRIVCELAKPFSSDQLEIDVAKREVKRLMEKAWERKKNFKNYEEGFRLSHGASDELPGLVVDVYQNMVLIQINTAGMDRLREEIRTTLRGFFPEKIIHFLDQESYRKAELLPFYEKDQLDRDLEVSENGFHYVIPASVLQKVGFYYDHRENREKMEKKILTCKRSFKKGADLFCYAGGWGLHLLRAGVENVTFVDQGNLEAMVSENIKRSGFEGRGKFQRADVFQYLDDCKVRGETFDILVSDPPAFKKNEKNKDAALAGYEKLHGKIFRVLEKEALLSICSCTHNISLEELDRTVTQAALKEGRRVYMLDVGIQGMDHSFSSFADKNHYLKYILYWVETL